LSGTSLVAASAVHIIKMMMKNIWNFIAVAESNMHKIFEAINCISAGQMKALILYAGVLQQDVAGQPRLF
jgi:hypothetical protein